MFEIMPVDSTNGSHVVTIVLVDTGLCAGIAGICASKVRLYFDRRLAERFQSFTCKIDPLDMM